ncbi:MAG: bifunctional diaminohydroxyphosphoribosylaminopyrimidine deaminase/5-amino-6-(5-phosphoribosylamino)uracil reductase RibD [Phycisphaerae bacterium]|nr:bifunctional diaminohydroxyphosphoribosylaminopyrimidine deaminase/5-amino-6-(5-phosphoribosylamino)uracil reductase RibD [Phycisphaerae bacterium]
MTDEQYMLRALELAGQGRGAVEPNPMVGAVIVRDGKIIAEGYHQRFGGPHAERVALAAAEQAGADVRGATMYVTLEPCSHHGKTPPCADAIIEAGLAGVVVAMVDPDTQVAGRGLEKLRRAGISVTQGLCERQAKLLLRAYIKLRTQSRPWVICKWAQTADGYLALPADAGRWISGQESRSRVHEIRSWVDGILVGIGTVLADDPLLNNRSGAGNQPVRVVLDSQLRIPRDCQLIRTADESPVIIATMAAAAERWRRESMSPAERAVEILTLNPTAGGVDFGELLDELGRRNWTYLLVEGGAGVLRDVIENNLADELQVFTSPLTLGQGQDLPRFDIADVLAGSAFRQTETETLGEDKFTQYLRTELSL